MAESMHDWLRSARVYPALHDTLGFRGREAEWHGLDGSIDKLVQSTGQFGETATELCLVNAICDYREVEGEHTFPYMLFAHKTDNDGDLWEISFLVGYGRLPFAAGN